MVNIFEKYGIKEVANVYFEALDDDAAHGVKKGDIVLYLDTLKVSTIESTAENAAATGGWGNPKLVMWDYGREINLTLEDALISLESLAFMFGGAVRHSEASKKVIINLTEQGTVQESNTPPLLLDHLNSTIEYDLTDKKYRWVNLTKGTRGTSDSFTADVSDVVRFFWSEETITDNTAVEISISPATFPGTYKVVGDTFMRSEKTGRDEPFQFVIGKAKVLSDVTISLEAEGDPSTFEMQLNVLRSVNERGENEMIKLIRYNSSEFDSVTENDG